MSKKGSKYKGVSFRKFGGRNYYYARIYIKGTALELGTYKTEEEAAKAYDKYVLRMDLGRKTNFNWKKVASTK